MMMQEATMTEPPRGTPQIRRALMPTRRRRLILLTTSVLFGGLGSVTLPRSIATAAGMPIVLVLALLAGFSALWSP